MTDPNISGAKSPQALKSLYEKTIDSESWSDSSGTPERKESEKSHYEAVDGEETEDASEDGDSNSYEIKEQKYLRELQLLKASLQELKYGRHPEYVQGLKKLEGERTERLRRSEVERQLEASLIEKEYLAEKDQAIREFEEKNNELKVELIEEYEQKGRQVIQDVFSMDLSMEDEANLTMYTPRPRRLRSRPNEDVPMNLSPEQVKLPETDQTQTCLKFYLSDDEIQNDIKDMNQAIKTEYGPQHEGAAVEISNGANPSTEIILEAATAPFLDSRIEDGKLFYEKKWFHRGQPVFVEGIDLPNKVSGVISSISHDTIWIRKVSDQSKLRVTINQLMKGTNAIKRRA